MVGSVSPKTPAAHHDRCLPVARIDFTVIRLPTFSTSYPHPSHFKTISLAAGILYTRVATVVTVMMVVQVDGGIRGTNRSVLHFRHHCPQTTCYVSYISSWWWPLKVVPSGGQRWCRYSESALLPEIPAPLLLLLLRQREPIDRK